MATPSDGPGGDAGLDPKARTAPDTPRAGEAEFAPYVGPGQALPEFSWRSVLAGIVFGIAFGAANAYLGLRVGLTISTSIPVAVMTVAAFRALARSSGPRPILEANMSQTIGSASSSVASGVIFTLPALFLWGLDPSLLEMTLLAICGGVIGILFMVPLRRFLIVREHGELPYPEGTACAEVLKASETGGLKARSVFLGLGVGAALKALTGLLHAVQDRLSVDLPLLPKARIGTEVSAALFGVGFILGPRIASIMVGGGLLSSLVIIPALAIWGADRAVPLYPEPTLLIAEMGAGDLWNRYVRYIGAGAVAMGGILTLIKSFPTMIESFRMGARQLSKRLAEAGSESGEATPRTQRELSFKTVGIGLALVAVVLVAFPSAFGVLGSPLVRLVATVLVIVCAFFFVTVSSRIVGLVGVTSNPTSGMTIAALLLTATIFALLGWTGDLGKVAALTVGCVVAIAASIAGDTSQDLKTGFLLGATPKRQQTGELLGVLTSAAFVCLAVIVMDRTFGLGGEELPAPQATMMKLVIEGVLESNLPWGLVAIGAAIAVVVELLGLPSLAFAVGVYLPVSTMVPVFLGGALRWLVQGRFDAAPDGEQSPETKDRVERGILFGSGLVGGEGILGVLIAVIALGLGAAPAGLGTAWAGPLAPLVGLGTLAGLAGLFWWVVRRRGSAA